ncbi:MAG: hypothetical protein UHS49_01270 [Faecalimonas sp.]|nr:hypothetical protein [Faecalimonas sp.]
MMRAGDYAKLQMNKMLKAGESLDENQYLCRVLRFDAKKEWIYLSLEQAELPAISLDAIYSCKIRTAEEQLSCTVRVRERYCGAEGKTLVLVLENGFYKINLNSVDK